MNRYKNKLNLFVLCFILMIEVIKLKERRDVTRTKNAIERAYLELLFQKGYSKITVNEVINLADVSRTGFADDASISAWAKPYVSTALYSGMISGYGNNSVAVFNPDQPITVSEAAVMLDNVLDLTDAASALQEENSSVPVWAAQSAANIQSCGLISSGTSIDSSVLNRGEAAEMLASALNMKK